jgi:hypothetical protein
MKLDKETLNTHEGIPVVRNLQPCPVREATPLPELVEEKAGITRSNEMELSTNIICQGKIDW